MTVDVREQAKQTMRFLKTAMIVDMEANAMKRKNSSAPGAARTPCGAEHVRHKDEEQVRPARRAHAVGEARAVMMSPTAMATNVPSTMTR